MAVPPERIVLPPSPPINEKVGRCELARTAVRTARRSIGVVQACSGCEGGSSVSVAVGVPCSGGVNRRSCNGNSGAGEFRRRNSKRR